MGEGGEGVAEAFDCLGELGGICGAGGERVAED